MNVAYITDSGSGKSLEEFARDGILSLPLQITDGNTTWQDMETLDKNGCIALLEQGKVLKTSQPAPGLIEELFGSLKQNGTDLVIAVPIASGLSGTSSTLTAMAAEAELPILCVDTYTACVIQDYLVHRIKEMMESGMNQLEMSVKVQECIDSCETIVVPKDLRHLARGGRLTSGAAHLASLLRIVPILHLNKETGGRIDIYDKVMTYRKAVKRILDHMKEKPIDSGWHIAVAHTNAIDAAQDLYHKVRETFPDAEIEIVELCNVVSAQAGLGCLALEYFKKI